MKALYMQAHDPSIHILKTNSTNISILSYNRKLQSARQPHQVFRRDNEIPVDVDIIKKREKSGSRRACILLEEARLFCNNEAVK